VAEHFDGGRDHDRAHVVASRLQNQLPYRARGEETGRPGSEPFQDEVAGLVRGTVGVPDAARGNAAADWFVCRIDHASGDLADGAFEAQLDRAGGRVELREAGGGEPFRAEVERDRRLRVGHQGDSPLFLTLDPTIAVRVHVCVHIDSTSGGVEHGDYEPHRFRQRDPQHLAVRIGARAGLESAAQRTGFVVDRSPADDERERRSDRLAVPESFDLVQRLAAGIEHLIAHVGIGLGPWLEDQSQTVSRLSLGELERNALREQ